jgi:hypothetical protein
LSWLEAASVIGELMPAMITGLNPGGADACESLRRSAADPRQNGAERLDFAL